MGGRSALRRLCRIIGVSLREIAGSAKKSEGSVSNFLNGKLMRADYALPIYQQVVRAAERMLRSGKLSSEEAQFVQKTITMTLVSFKNTGPRRDTREARASSMAAIHVAEVIMALTDAPRLNLTKDFEYSNERHFRAHARCVRLKVKYHWLVYEGVDLKRQWEEYYKKLIAHIAAEEKTEIGELPSSVLSLLQTNIDCRVYPLIAQERGRLLPFRITVFAQTKFDCRDAQVKRDCDVCLCTEEPDLKTYPLGRTIVIGQPMVSSIRTALEELYGQCLPIEELGSSDYRKKEENLYDGLVKCHNELRAQVLRACIASRLLGEPASLIS